MATIKWIFFKGNNWGYKLMFEMRLKNCVYNKLLFTSKILTLFPTNLFLEKFPIHFFFFNLLTFQLVLNKKKKKKQYGKRSGYMSGSTNR